MATMLNALGLSTPLTSNTTLAAAQPAIDYVVKYSAKPALQLDSDFGEMPDLESVSSSDFDSDDIPELAGDSNSDFDFDDMPELESASSSDFDSDDIPELVGDSSSDFGFDDMPELEGNNSSDIDDMPDLGALALGALGGMANTADPCDG